MLTQNTALGARFLQVASGLLPCAFEESDAQEKYGKENNLSGLMGGRSLRSTAELIYQRSVNPFVLVQRTNDKDEKETGEGAEGVRMEKYLLRLAMPAGWVKFLENVGPSLARMGDIYIWRAHLRFNLQRSLPPREEALPYDGLLWFR